MKRKAVEDAEMPAGETPAYKALQTGLKDVVWVYEFMSKRNIKTCYKEDVCFQRLERLYDYVQEKCNCYSEQYQMMKDIVYEFLGLLYFSTVRGYELTVTEKDIEYCLSSQLTGSIFAIRFYLNRYSVFNETDETPTFETKKAQFIYEMKNCIQTVLQNHNGRRATGLIKTKKISDKKWVLTADSSFLGPNGYECPALFETVLSE
jgi:hypothetical protein